MTVIYDTTFALFSGFCDHTVIIESQFQPAWWLRNRHLQTIWPALFRRRNRLELRWQTLDTDDGDFVDLVWTRDCDGPIIVLLHGLEGSINSRYIRGMLHRVERQGWQGVLMHFRGCGGRHNRLQRSYHAGETGDLRYFIKYLERHYPNRGVAIIGFSLGGNVLLKYLGEEGNRSMIRVAAVVSVPFELAKGAARLDRGASRFYRRYLINRLANKMRYKFLHRPAPFDMTRMHKWSSFALFDDYVTARLHGFKNADDYYAKCSSRQFIKDIRVPTLIIHARDDPFLTAAAIPGLAELSDQVTLELADTGGHVGFVGGRFPFQSTYWLERRIPAFFKSRLNS